MTTRSTIVYQLEDAPPLDRLLDSMKYAYCEGGQVFARFTVSRFHAQKGNEHTVRFVMDECIVLGIEYVSAYPLTVEVKLYVPPMGGGHINHKATARLSYPRRDGTFESFQD